MIIETNFSLTNTNPIAAAGKASPGTWHNPTKMLVDRIIALMFEVRESPANTEAQAPTKAQFMADLKRASSKAKPGRGLSREEGIQRIVETYPDTLASLKD